jgi:DNA-binding NarL/FixJ family response regulator
VTARFFMVTPKPLHDLGFKEREVLLAYGRGQTFQEIADTRGNAYSTIKNQLESAHKKLGGRRTIDAYMRLIAIEDKARNKHA